MFRKKLFIFIKPLKNDTCGSYDALGVRLLHISNLLKIHNVLKNFKILMHAILMYTNHP